MSLAYKLWKIGSVLKEDDVKNMIKLDFKHYNGNEHDYVNINFNLSLNGVINAELRDSRFDMDKMFFTKKIGGSGQSVHYLYPNLDLKLTEKESLFNKWLLINNTIKHSLKTYSDGYNFELVTKIASYIDDGHLDPILEQLKNVNNGKYWFWISINDSSIPELMPEIWLNWFKNPTLKSENTKPGFDVFTNKEETVGYNPDFKVFTYDQYHYSINHRLCDNVALSLTSAKYIKFAWIFITEKLHFFHKNLEYVIIPNMIKFDGDDLHSALRGLVKANEKSINKSKLLRKLKNDLYDLESELKKLQEDKKFRIKEMEWGSFDNSKEQELEKQINVVLSRIDINDTGFVREFNEHVKLMGESKNPILLDFIFVTINKTNLSFEIKGSIQDVVPNQLTKLVDLMNSNDNMINDNITVVQRNDKNTFLQDYFNRNELFFNINKTQLHNKNRIVQERLHLIKLLITSQTTSMEDLRNRFAFHREFNYKHKRRIKKGVKDWVRRAEKYTKYEKRLITFFTKLNKIKE